MTDNNTQPIAWQHGENLIRRLGGGGWLESTDGGAIYRSELPADAVPLVRADEAQKTAESGGILAALRHAAEAATAWRSECEKAQTERDKYMADLICAKADADYLIEQRELAEDRVTALTAERDELRVEVEKLYVDRDQARAEMDAAVAERDELQRLNGRLKEAERADHDVIARLCTERDELREKLAEKTRDLANAADMVADARDGGPPAPDANNPAQCRFATDVLVAAIADDLNLPSAVAETVRTYAPWDLSRRADRLEAEQEQVSRRGQAIETLARVEHAHRIENAEYFGAWDEMSDFDRNLFLASARALVDAFPDIVDVITRDK